MRSQLAAGAVRLAAGNAARHIHHAHAALDVCASCQRQVTPLACSHLPHAHRPAKCIRVCYGQRALCSIDFKHGQVVAPDIKAHHNRGYRTAVKINRAGDVRGNAYRQHLALDGFVGGGALLKCALGGAGHAPCRPQQIHQCG